MKNNIYLVLPKSFLKNEIFNLNSPHNRDNCLYPYYLLKKNLFKKGFILNTYDYFNKNKKENYSLLFLDFPSNMNYFLKNHNNINKYLIIYESPIKNPENQILDNHKYFKKIFTWDSRFIDNKKYFKLNYSLKLPKKISQTNFNNKKLCCAIFGHKKQTHKLELYSERIKTIKWFEKNHLKDFDLYGSGWNRYYFKDKLFHLNRLKFLTKIIKPDFPSWRGSIQNKIEVYPNYKFAICYENAKYLDYITEKIFDCFFSRCVPIYLGAPNIEKIVPSNTFIDKRNFKTENDLYNFINCMSELEYNKYIVNIETFLKSKNIYPFLAEYFAETLTKEIINKK